MKYRTERDSMGEVKVPQDKLWGAQTQRSLENFKIGTGHEQMPTEIIRAFAIMKKAAARANGVLCPERMSEQKQALIEQVADQIYRGELDDQFPLVVFQTGSGTQTNMNVNEVIANRANAIAGYRAVHPNDDVNMSQSSNDTFPTAMHIAAYIGIVKSLIPALNALISELEALENRYGRVIKCGRTHLQDATPITFGQEISGWYSSLARDRDMILSTAEYLKNLSLGATAVGTGLNAPQGFGALAAEKISEICGIEFYSEENKFHSLTSKGELVASHGAIKALASDLWKIANDIRFLSSGPRCGIGEISIPENEPGSSIMPGKVNPTQCEAITMVAARVMGNDTTVGLCASQGNFQLNVFMPVCIYSFLQSVRLLSEGMESFRIHCVSGIRPREDVMSKYLNRSLMTVTALNPHIGYDNAARCAHLAHEKNISLKEACLALGLMSEEDFDKVFKFSDMV